MFNKDDGFAGPATCKRHIVDRRHGIVSTRKHVTADIRPSSPVQRGRKGQIVRVDGVVDHCVPRSNNPKLPVS